MQDSEVDKSDLDILIDNLTPETRFNEADERVQSLRLDDRLTEQQIAAIASDDLGVLEVDALSPSPLKPKVNASSEDLLLEKTLQNFQEASNVFDVRAREAKLGKVDSHELVDLDKNGEPFYERFVFVDEHRYILHQTLT
jgi:hypothetical protein